MNVILVAIQLLVVELIDGRKVAINPNQVTHLSEAQRDVDPDKQLAAGINCVIFLTDKSYVSTGENCTSIVNRWMQLKQEPK